MGQPWKEDESDLAAPVPFDKVNAKSRSWQSWENRFAIKRATEASGWKQKSDDKGVIEALEGMQMANSVGFAQGAKTLRKQDHSGIIDCYISHIENDELHVKKKVSKEEMAKLLPPRFDFSTQLAVLGDAAHAMPWAPSCGNGCSRRSYRRSVSSLARTIERTVFLASRSSRAIALIDFP